MSENTSQALYAWRKGFYFYGCDYLRFWLHYGEPLNSIFKSSEVNFMPWDNEEGFLYWGADRNFKQYLLRQSRERAMNLSVFFKEAEE